MTKTKHIGPVIKEIKKHSSYKNISTLGVANRKWFLYKYFNMENAIRFLNNGKLCFVEPSEWVDPYEKRFYTADYSQIKSYNPPSKVFCTCVTKNKTSEAAWKIYAYDAKGLAARCIQFKFNRTEFLKALEKFGYETFEGSVNYEYSDSIIDSLHKDSKQYHDDYFDNFSLEKYLNLLLIKRGAFEYENEIRYFLINNKPTTENKIFVEVSPKDLIEEVHVDRHCTEFEMELITNACLNAKIKVVPNKFDLYKPQPKITIEP